MYRTKNLPDKKQPSDFRSAQDCRDQAQRLRDLAAKAKTRPLQWDYQQLASQWDMIADQIEMLRRDRG
jgi:hypothetical protein